MNSTSTSNVSEHEYINLFVEEHLREKMVGESTLFVTWCVGIVKAGIFYGTQVSKSNLLSDNEVIIVDFDYCDPIENLTYAPYDYTFSLGINQPPRENSKLTFQPRSELPATIRVALIKAIKKHKACIRRCVPA